MSAPEREVEKPMTPAVPAPAPVTMSALLASCAAATAVSTPPRQASARQAAPREAVSRQPASRDGEKGTAGQREAA